MRVTLASTAETRFAQAVKTNASQIDALPDETLAAMLREIERFRLQVTARLASIPPDQWAYVRAETLQNELLDVSGRFVERYTDLVQPLQEDAWDAGATLVSRPLLESDLMLHAPILSRRLLEAARGYQALLISNASADTIAKISSMLRLGIMAQQSVPEILQRIAVRLDDPGPFGSLAVRAEAITRTEIGRIQSIATQATMEDSSLYVKTLQKEWMHSGVPSPRAREGHIEAHGTVVDVRDVFSVRPRDGYDYEDMLYPRDPGASAANTVFCGCLATPYMEAWDAAIKAARNEASRYVRPDEYTVRMDWNEEDHPREPSGSSEGGQFVEAGGGVAQLETDRQFANRIAAKYHAEQRTSRAEKEALRESNRARDARTMLDFLKESKDPEAELWIKDAPGIKTLRPLLVDENEMKWANMYGELHPHECFDQAGEFIRFNSKMERLPEGTMLVHGTYQPDPHDEVYAHGWVELPGNVVFDGVLQRYFDRGDYYKAMRAHPKVRYTPEQAMKRMVRYGHNGPWQKLGGI